MMGVLRDQIDFLERLAVRVEGELTPSPHPGAGVLNGWDGLDAVEDQINVGLATFESLKQAVCRRSDRIDSGKEAFRIEGAREVQALFRHLFEAFDGVRGLIRKCKSLGLEVEGAERFRRARGELGAIASISADRVHESNENLSQGKGIPLAEAVGELPHHRRAEGA